MACSFKAVQAQFIPKSFEFFAGADTKPSTDNACTHLEEQVSKSEHALEAQNVGEEQIIAPDSDATLLLQNITTLLIREVNNGSLYDRVLDAALNLMSADMGSMQVFHPERGELRLLTQRGFHPESAAFWKWVRLDSASTCGMALSSGCRVVVPDVEAYCAFAGTADLDAYRRSHIRAVQTTPLIARTGHVLGMISTHWRMPHHPTERELQLLDGLAGQAAELIERNERRDQLRWLASIVDSSDDAIISKNLHGVISSWNKGAEQLFGYSAEEVIGKSIAILIPSERLDEEDIILSRIRQGDRIDHYETIRRRKDGSPIDVALSISPIRDENGKVVGASKIARDITERKRNEAQIAALAREAEHRAKNLLANVKAMVHLSHADTPEGLKEAIEGRIEALANVHSLFAQSRWTGAELGTLIRQELSPYCRDGERCTRVEGPTVMLGRDNAQAIAVAVHELATNAAKYGALSVDTGQIRVEWSRADGRLVLRWTETGGPHVNPPTRNGFGTSVMEAMIRDHVCGELRRDWNADGLACEIAIPM